MEKFVSCVTKEQCSAVIQRMVAEGCRPINPDHAWCSYGREVVIRKNNDKHISYANRQWYTDHGYGGRIITAHQYLNRTNKPILITRKGRVVTAEDKNSGEKAIATCSPTDTFDFGTGASIALARLMAKTPEILTDDVKAEWKKVLGIKEVKAYTDDDRNFKVGDRVVVRDWGDMAREYGTKDDSISFDGDSTSFVPEMKHLCGRTATITDMNDNYVRVEFDDKSGDTGWYFRRWMFNPSDSDRPTAKFNVDDLVTLKDGLKVGEVYGGLTLREGMYDRGHNKPLNVLVVSRGETFSCAPVGGGLAYWYSEEMLEPWCENKICEGDKVHVKKGCTKDRYDTYYQWLKDNISDVDFLLGFERSDAISTTDTYTVVKIAPHGHFADLQLAFIKRTNGFGDTFSYLYNVEALEKVTE